MTQFLPPNLLALFAPRDPIPFLPPPDKLPHEKKSRGYVGVGGFLNLFEVSFFFLLFKLIFNFIFFLNRIQKILHHQQELKQGRND